MVGIYQNVYSKNDPNNAKHPNIASTLMDIGAAYFLDDDIENACVNINQAVTMFKFFSKHNVDQQDLNKATNIADRYCVKG